MGYSTKHLGICQAWRNRIPSVDLLQKTTRPSAKIAKSANSLPEFLDFIVFGKTMLVVIHKLKVLLGHPLGKLANIGRRGAQPS